MKPFEFTTDTGLLTLPANGSVVGVIRVLADQGFLWDRLTLVTDTTPGAELVITDEDAGRDLSDAAIPVEAITGDGRFPYWLPTKTYLPPYSVLTFRFSNTTGGAILLQPVLRGSKLNAAERDRVEREGRRSQSVFWHRADLALAAAVGAFDNDQVSISAEAPFRWQELQASTRVDYDLSFRSQASGDYFSSGAIPVETIAGDGQRPGRLSSPRDIPAREEIQVTGTNRSAGALAPILTLGGTRLW